MPLALYGSCSSLSGHPRAFRWARLGRFGPSAESCFSYKDLKYFQQYGCSHGSLGLFRAVLDPSRWPRGSVGGPSFARTWYHVFSFFCIGRIFSTTSIFQPPGGAKGGVLEPPGEFFYKLGRRSGVDFGGVSAPSNRLFIDFGMFFRSWPGGMRGTIESAAPVPGCRAC